MQWSPLRPTLIVGAALLLSGCAASYELRLPAGLIATAAPYLTNGDDDDGLEGGASVSITRGEP